MKQKLCSRMPKASIMSEYGTGSYSGCWGGEDLRQAGEFVQ